MFKKFYLEEKEILNKKLEEFNKNLVKEENPFIRENLEYFKTLNSDGKLVRGTLVDLGYYLLKDNREYSNDLALAYEVFQTAILVHDDIIDRDRTRRGKDTIHYANYKKYEKISKDKEELMDLSNSIAICMGDLGLFSANKLISKSYEKDKNLGKILNHFNDTVLKTIKGELLDVDLPFQSKNNKMSGELLKESIMNVYLLKTAHYTVIGPLTTGMLLAGAEEDKINEIASIGEKVGIAFQIQDDILGIFSNDIGKVVGSDIREFKQTILYSYTINTEYKDELLKYYGKDISNDIISKVRDIFESSGALEYAINTMNKYYDEAVELLSKVAWLDMEKKLILQGFIDYLRDRNK